MKKPFLKIISLILSLTLVFSIGTTGVVASEKVFDVYEDTKSILFALTCSGIWIGLFNTIQE